MTQKPTEFPTWATAGSKVQPSSAVRSTGHQAGVPPKASFENYDRDLIDKWLQYFDERFIPQYKWMHDPVGAVDSLVEDDAAIVNERKEAPFFFYDPGWGQVDSVTEAVKSIHCDGRYVVYGLDSSSGKVKCVERDGSLLWTSASIAAFDVKAICSDGTYVFAAASKFLHRYTVAGGVSVDSYTMPGTGSPVIHNVLVVGSKLFVVTDYDDSDLGCVHRFDKLDLQSGPEVSHAFSGVGNAAKDLCSDGKYVWVCGDQDASNFSVYRYDYDLSAPGATEKWKEAGPISNDALCITHDEGMLFVGTDSSAPHTETLHALYKAYFDNATMPPEVWTIDTGIAVDYCIDITCDGRFVYAVYSAGYLSDVVALDRATGAVVDVILNIDGQPVRAIYADDCKLWAGYDADGATTDAVAEIEVKPPPMVMSIHDHDTRYRLKSQLITRAG